MKNEDQKDHNASLAVVAADLGGASPREVREGYIDGVCGVLYLGIGVSLGTLAPTDVWPYNALLALACATNTLFGAQLVVRAFRKAYR